tara:strand:+ start:1816 stop:3051 length:1236 start_codon:yes stop_codon:yes gene_type:complete
MTLTQIQRDGLDAEALDQVYTVGASGTDHYTFQGEGLNGTVNDPTLYLTRGKTYRFEKGSAHPLRIQSTQGASGTAYNTGVTNNGGTGTVIMEVQHDAPDVLYYQCTSHANMNGILYTVGALADSGVTTAKLADDAVTQAKVAAGAIGNTELASGAVSTTKIDTNAVTAAKIASSSVGSSQLASNAVTTDKIADSAVTTPKIADGTISSAKYSNASITTEKIANDAITGAKIGDNAVATANIGDNQVTDAKINSMSASKLTGALPAISGASLTNLPGGGKVIRVIPVLSSGESTYWYYNQGSPWITTGAITNVSSTSRFLIFGRFELRQATQHNSVYSQASFSASGGSTYGGGSDSTNNTSWRTTQFTAYDYASNTNNREYSYSVSSNGSNSTYGAKVRNAFILVLELDAS